MKKIVRRIFYGGLTLVLLVGAVLWATWMGDGPMIQADDLEQVSQRVYVIPDNNAMMVPNVGIVVGDDAILVIDPGLGPRNGEIVQSIVEQVGGSSEENQKQLFVVTTHFHPEHSMGVEGLRDDAQLIVPNVQQQELDTDRWIKRMFKASSPVNTKLLWGVDYPDADITFDSGFRLELGGATAHIFHRGPMHTRGDTMIYIEQESVLFSGDVVMKGLFPVFATTNGSVATWLDTLNVLDALEPDVVVGSHGNFGDISMIRDYQRLFSIIQASAQELYSQGVDESDAVDILLDEIDDELPQLNANGFGMRAAVKAAYREASEL